MTGVCVLSVFPSCCFSQGLEADSDAPDACQDQSESAHTGTRAL